MPAVTDTDAHTKTTTTYSPVEQLVGTTRLGTQNPCHSVPRVAAKPPLDRTSQVWNIISKEARVSCLWLAELSQKFHGPQQPPSPSVSFAPHLGAIHAPILSRRHSPWQFQRRKHGCVWLKSCAKKADKIRTRFPFAAVSPCGPPAVQARHFLLLTLIILLVGRRWLETVFALCL